VMAERITEAVKQHDWGHSLPEVVHP